MIVNPFIELPLAIFTTLMPVAAGALIGIAIAILAGFVPSEKLKKIDQLTSLPIILLLIGFVGAFFHLSSPLNAVFALSGFGQSPLSNEIVAASVFTVASILYWILALSGKLSEGLRRGWLIIIVILAVMLAVFTGLAYHVDTIPTWASIWPVIEMLGYLLISIIVGAFVVQIAGVDITRSYGKTIVVLALAGFVIALIATTVHMVSTSGLSSYLVDGATLVSTAIPYLTVACIALILGVSLTVPSLKRTSTTARYAAASALVVVGVFCARLAFYCIRLNIGL